MRDNESHIQMRVPIEYMMHMLIPADAVYNILARYDPYFVR